MEERIYSLMTLAATLFLIFLMLKLIGLIEWSWWWVASPLLFPAAVILGSLIIILIAIVGKDRKTPNEEN